MYKEDKPDILINPSVDAFWNIYNQENSVTEKIIPDGCSDIIIKLGLKGRSFEVLDVFAVGLMTSSIITSINRNEGYIGARLMPHILKGILNVDMSELKDGRVSINFVNKGLFTKLKDVFSKSSSYSQAAEIFKMLLSKEIYNVQASTNFPADIIQKLISCGGSLNIQAVAKNCGISLRRLERLFKKHVGASPKKYSRIIRFKRAYDFIKKSETSPASQNSIDFGYYDQSHFIKDFKEFSSSTPGSF